MTTQNTATSGNTNTDQTTGQSEPPCFDAALTSEQVEAIEANANAVEQHRRLALSALTKNSKELLESFRGEDDSLIESIEALSDYCTHLKHSLEMADAAFARMMLVGKFISKENKGQ